MGSMTRKGQVYSVGNYLMTGKVFGKGHFARVEEATHRIIGKKVAIKIIDLTCIKEEYARRNLHREPRVMAKLRHPCIAALYETMMHGPRLYVVMEAACGGDLCAHVLAHGGRARSTHGLPEPRAKALAAQLVSAVKHMHARGVVHRDLKMENIMLDATKQFIKIVDFGLSNMWSSGGALRTPCGSLEYAAPELFVDGRKYGPEVDLWSVGVIVYGMVTGALPFTGGGERGAGGGGGATAGGGGGATAGGGGGATTGGGAAAGGERAALRAAIARGLTRRQRTALAGNSPDCRGFIQQLLEPNVDLRMKIDEAAKHRWIKRAGMRMKTHPLLTVEPKVNRDIYKQISDLCGQSVFDVIASVKAEPFGATAGMYNIKSHLHQINSGGDLLWTSNPIEPRPDSPPDYTIAVDCPSTSKVTQTKPVQRIKMTNSKINETQRQPIVNRPNQLVTNRAMNYQNSIQLDLKSRSQESNLSHVTSNIRKPAYRIYDNGDCSLNNRLPSIDEHSNADLKDHRGVKSKNLRTPRVKRVSLDEERHLRLSAGKLGDAGRTNLYRRSGDGVPSWRSSSMSGTPPPRILLQSNATTIKRASQGNIISPHSSCNSHCKSERAMPVGWYSKTPVVKEATHFQRLRRTAPIK